MVTGEDWFSANEPAVTRYLKQSGYVLRRCEELARESEPYALSYLKACFEHEVGRSVELPRPMFCGPSEVELARQAYEQNPGRQTAERYARARLRETITHPDLPPG